MSQLSGAEALVRMLALHGVRPASGLCGATSQPLYDVRAGRGRGGRACRAGRLLHARVARPSLCLVRPDGDLGCRAAPPSAEALRAHRRRILRPLP